MSHEMMTTIHGVFEVLLTVNVFLETYVHLKVL